MTGAFWAKVDKNGPVPAHRPDLGPCWLWTGTNDGRYGRQYQSGMGRSEGAHRLASELADGPIPDGLSVLHHCDTPLCVRPTHLFRGTQTVNVADMMAKGRVARGERASRARLTEADVRRLRDMAARGTDRASLGRTFGITAQYAGRVVDRRTWTHVA